MALLFALASALLAAAYPVMVMAGVSTQTVEPTSTPMAAARWDISGALVSGGQLAGFDMGAGSTGVSVAVTPDATRSIAPGFPVTCTVDVTNDTTEAGLFALATTSSAGFETRLSSLEGTSVTTTALGAGETTQVVLTLSVPETATVGMTVVTTVTATLDSSAGVTAQASSVTEVMDGLSITPGFPRSVKPGTDVWCSHTVTNSWPTTRTVMLSHADTEPWPVVFYSSDGTTVITSMTLGPYGDRQETLARVSVPMFADPSTIDTLTIMATAGTATVTATDTLYVHILDTYANSDYSTPTADFRLTDTVYAFAEGLDPGTVVCFVWKDPLGATVRTSATATVETTGTAADSYSSLTTDPVGVWALELREGNAEGSVIETRTFVLDYKGEITALSGTDAGNMDATVSVTATVHNLTEQTIPTSTVTYLIWWDEGGDGEFDIGDTYIDATGTPQPYSVDATTHVTVIPSLAATATWSEPVPWGMLNSQFPNQGTYNVTATWRSPSGSIIDVKTAQFFAIPTLGWIPLTIMVGSIAFVMWRQREKLLGAAVRR